MCVFYIHSHHFDRKEFNYFTRAVTVNATIVIVQDIYSEVQLSDQHLKEVLVEAAKFASKETVKYILERENLVM